MKKSSYELVHRQIPGNHKWSERRIYVRSVTKWLHCVLIELDLYTDERYHTATKFTVHMEHYVFGSRERAERKYV